MKIEQVISFFAIIGLVGLIALIFKLDNNFIGFTLMFLGISMFFKTYLESKKR